MKISRIPNFGSFGVYVDDIDMNTIGESEWMELGRLFVQELVVVLRNINMTQEQYHDWVLKLGPRRSNIRSYFVKKYSTDFDATQPHTWHNIDSEDRMWLEQRKYQLEDIGNGKHLTRVWGRKDEQGHLLGYFSHGEVHWHHNEGSSITAAPAVALLGWSDMGGSATGFVQTVDLYESLSESMRSELDQMVLIHEYTVGRVNETEHTDPYQRQHVKYAFCPVDGAETPLVCTAPNGRRGLHYTVTTRAGIRGMSTQDSQNLFEHLDCLVFDHRQVFDHYYTDQRRDLLLFDNSVTLHRRLGGQPDRKAFRTQFDLSPCMDHAWRPYQHMPEFDQQYISDMQDTVRLVGGDFAERFKMPVLT